MTIVIDGIYREGSRGLIVQRLTGGFIRFILILVTFPFSIVGCVVVSGGIIN
jgi:hypothetical protein